MGKNIYAYTDYRDFLRDRYAEKKQAENLTLRELAQKAGFNTHTFFANVIERKRSLTSESAAKVARGLGLHAAERTYLELMVRFDNARTVDEKSDLYEQMRACIPPNEIRQIDVGCFDIFRNAYVLTVRELVALPDFKPDGKWIASKLRPKITALQATKAIELLLKNNLLQKDSHGKLGTANADLTTGEEVKSLAIALYHKQLLALAAAAVDETAAKDRDISALTLNVSKSEFNFIKRRIAAFRRELLDFLQKKRDNSSADFGDDRKRAIYHLAIQFFNATEVSW